MNFSLRMFKTFDKNAIERRKLIGTEEILRSKEIKAEKMKKLKKFGLNYNAK